MSKTYATAQIAEKIATRLSKKGELHIAIEQAPGSWVVMKKANKPVDAPVENLPDEVSPPETETMVLPGFGEVEVKIPAPEPVSVKVAENITVILPEGSYEKGGYVYTPQIDGKPRWFKTDKLLGLALENGRVKITVTPKVLKARGLTPEMLEAQAA
jgi:hypothetical protein